MIAKEIYEREITRMFDSVRTKCKGYSDCRGVRCSQCPLRGLCGITAWNAFKMIEFVEQWSKEHQKPKHKVSQLEYDILESIVKTISSGLYFFECDSLLMSLLEKGYFDGATCETDVKEYFENCEVKEDV